MADAEQPEQRVKSGVKPMPFHEAKNLEVPQVILGRPLASPKSDLELKTPASSMLGRFHHQ